MLSWLVYFFKLGLSHLLRSTPRIPESSVLLSSYDPFYLHKLNSIFHNFVAPEQTGGMEALAEDHRTDLYSLGIVFWTLLVGRGTMPFEGRPLELLHAIVHKRPLPVHEVRRDVPQVLAFIIEKVGVNHSSHSYQPVWGEHNLTT